MFRRRCFKTSKFYRILLLALVFINTTLIVYNMELMNIYRRQIKETDTAHPSQTIPLESSKEFSSAGYTLATFVRRRCNDLRRPLRYEFSIPFWLRHMHLLQRNKTLYCPVEKVGTTFWRRAIYQAEHGRTLRHPYQVPIYDALSQNLHYPQQYQMEDKNFQFFFVRNPFYRILSAYIDKIFVPNPQFWDRFGKHSIQMFRTNDSRTCYHDATFSEFVQFVVWSVRNLKNIDPHFLPATEMCVPCNMNYSFVGKMESFSSDIYPVLEKLRLDTTIPVLKKHMKELSDIDAIQDSIYSPYGWKKEILKCIDWHEALLRVWRKLQIRGFIDMDHKFPISKQASERISRGQFFELAKRAWKSSNVLKLKKQKNDAFTEMYRSVPLDVLQDLAATFEIDFHLYNYDSSPKAIFDRSDHFTAHNFADFRS